MAGLFDAVHLRNASIIPFGLVVNLDGVNAKTLSPEDKVLAVPAFMVDLRPILAFRWLRRSLP